MRAFIIGSVLLTTAAGCERDAASPLQRENTPARQAAGGPGLEPGGTPEAAANALRNPDEYAWQLFLYLNRQAAPGKAGLADQNKASAANYDADTDTVWETWALESGLDLEQDKNNPGKKRIVTNKSEVFTNPAKQPAPWDSLDRSKGGKILSRDFKTMLVGAGITDGPRSLVHITIAPPGTSPEDDEVRMNRSTYETVRNQHLYSVEGIEAAAAAAKKSHSRSIVSFEPMSKEIKARWKHLAPCDANPKCAEKARYHWRTVVSPQSGKAEIWALVSLHIITKDLPSWFWADFGHIDCESQAGACADEKEAAQTPLRDSTTTATDGIRKEAMGTKWQYYRLRGTQIDFASTTGVANILSNPVIESTFQPSSCMTCHSYASSGLPSQVPATGTTLPGLTGAVAVRNARSQAEDVGEPNCARFVTPGGKTTGKCLVPFDSGDPLYFQTDFLWSLPFRAFSEKP